MVKISLCRLYKKNITQTSDNIDLYLKQLFVLLFELYN